MDCLTVVPATTDISAIAAFLPWPAAEAMIGVFSSVP
jgi:hypothetical protein